MSGTLSGTDAWFKNPASQVSSHYGIGLTGEVHQYVKEDDMAWANGRVQNPTSKIVKSLGGNPNNYSISIEHEGTATIEWSKAMKDTSAELIREIAKRHKIPLDRDHIIGHYEIFSGKPNCPAKDKSIIDELIRLANGEEQNESMKMNKKMLDMLKRIKLDLGDNFDPQDMDRLANRVNDILDKHDDMINSIKKIVN